jgi:type IV secretory pathway VirB10-like protein
MMNSARTLLVGAALIGAIACRRDPPLPDERAGTTETTGATGVTPATDPNAIPPPAPYPYAVPPVAPPPAPPLASEESTPYIEQQETEATTDTGERAADTDEEAREGDGGADRGFSERARGANRLSTVGSAVDRDRNLGAGEDAGPGGETPGGETPGAGAGGAAERPVEGSRPPGRVGAGRPGAAGDP